jgi:hypothetical protein
MPALSDLGERLNQQFLDPQNLNIQLTPKPKPCARSGWHECLFGRQYTLEGLDGALESSLPDTAYLYWCAGRRLSRWISACPNIERLCSAIGREETIRLWCAHLTRQFDAGLDRLRALSLQSEAGLPFGAWTWNESPHWREEGEL